MKANDLGTSDPTIPPASGPLAGVRVVDLSTSYAGPSASMYLADLGADVIKVERPGTGDDARAWGPPFVEGISAWFASVNRNKRSVALDIRTERGTDTLMRLLDNADVFLENMNPSKLSSRGLHPDTLCKRNPRLIYCALSGFGLTGPYASNHGYDLVAQARSGLMSVTGAKGGPPQRVSTALSDVVTGMCAALAISAAVVQQRETGRGDVIDVSLLDTDLALMAPRIAAFLAGDAEPAPSGGSDSVIAVYQSFATADRPIILAIGNDAIWHRFCTAAELPELASDERFQDNSGRRAHRESIIGAIERRLVERPAAEWLRIFDRAQVPCGPIQFLSEVVNDEQVRARRSLLPVAGSPEGLYSVHSPFRLASISQPRNEAIPKLGADTRAVLRESGLSEQEIDQLNAENTIHAA